MIYVNKQEVSEKDFASLLEKTKQSVEKLLQSKTAPRTMSGEDFEDLVYSHMVKVAIGTGFEGLIEQTGPHAFPDIVARKLYGVEVKMTIGNKWVTTGNSVLETTRVESVKLVYFFFGKFGSRFAAKYRKYEECLYEVGVTHSPRYKINMDLAPGESIFDKIGVSYEEFRIKDDQIKVLKDYYRGQLKEGEELWWIDPVAEETSVSPVIKPFRLLDVQTKGRYSDEVFILFPEIFGSSTLKFERPAAYLIINYNAVSSNIRDNFSASGRENIQIDGEKVEVSRILYNFFIRAKNIKKLLESLPKEKLSYYWKTEAGKNPMETWKSLLIKYAKESAEKIDIVSVFEAGLKDEKN